MKDKERASTTTLRTRRELLRRRRRERQFVVFGALLCAMATITFFAFNIYSGRTEGPFGQPFTSPAPAFLSNVTLACPPNNTTPLPESQVLVRVLNSTSRSGLAQTTLDDLVGRGFQSGGIANFKRFLYLGTARISFGKAGVVQAYTVARHFTSAELVLDTRKGTGVDVVLGDAFDGLVPLYSPTLDPTLILTASADCLPASLIDAEPAPQRYPVASPAPSGATPSPTASTVNGD